MKNNTANVIRPQRNRSSHYDTDKTACENYSKLLYRLVSNYKKDVTMLQNADLFNILTKLFSKSRKNKTANISNSGKGKIGSVIFFCN